MYEVKISGSEVLMDLIGRMADLTAAQYETRLVLRTESERLAGAVSKLVGEPLVVDPELDERTGLGFGVLSIPEIFSPLAKEDGSPYAFGPEGMKETVRNLALAQINPTAPEHKNGKAALTGRCRYCGKAIAERRVICQGAECKRRADQEKDERYKPKRAALAQARVAAKDYGTCEFCDAPRLPRSKTCGGEECGKKLAKKHQLAYQARKEAEAAKAVEAEVAKSESPFPDVTATEPFYEVEYPDQTLRLKFQDLMAQNQAGEIPDGTRVRALPSGRWYALRGGRLIPAGQ
jgi:hypothetical protein